MIKFRFGMTDEQIESLDDNAFYNLASQAYLMNEIQKDIICDGVIAALNKIGG